MNRRRSEIIVRLIAPTVVFVIAVLTVEAYIRAAGVLPFNMVPPSQILRVIFAPESTIAVNDQRDLITALGWTTVSALGGFGLSAVIGMLLAIGLSASSLLRRAVYPYTIFFQTVPIIAIAPMLLRWLGPGVMPTCVCSFIVSVFPVIANTLSGLLSTDPALVDLFRLYGAGRLGAMWKLRLPSALPSIFTGLRIAAGLAVIGALVSEFLVGQTVGHKGLGVLVIEGFHYGDLALAFAAVLLASMLGLAMFAAVNLASWLTLRNWHASER